MHFKKLMVCATLTTALAGCFASSPADTEEGFLRTGETPPAVSSLVVTGSVPKGFSLDAQIQVVATNLKDKQGHANPHCTTAGGAEKTLVAKSDLVHKPVEVTNSKFEFHMNPGKSYLVPGAALYEDAESPSCAPVASTVTFHLQGLVDGKSVSAQVLAIGHDPKMASLPENLEVVCRGKKHYLTKKEPTLACQPAERLSQNLIFRQTGDHLILTITLDQGASADVPNVLSAP